MIRPFKTRLILSFWASPYNAMDAGLTTRRLRGERNASTLKVPEPALSANASAYQATGFVSQDKPPKAPPPTSFPTDVPAPEPHDVPAPEPIDVPPPEPKDPTPPKSAPRRDRDPKPRPVP